MSALLAFVLPFAGCGAMMLLCARMMRRNDCATDPAAAVDAAEVARLRAEVTDLRARLGPATQPDETETPVP